MRTYVQCQCGWQRSLSPFYAGKQLRCPDCQQVVTAEGSDRGGAYRFARGGPPASVRVIYVPVPAPRTEGTRAVAWLAVSAVVAMFVVMMAGPRPDSPHAPAPMPSQPELQQSPAPAPPPANAPAAPKLPDRDLEREDEF